MRITPVLATLAAAATLAACSSNGGSSTTAPPPSTSGPASCSALVGDPHWAATLAKDSGCMNAAGTSLIIATSFDCSDGSKLYRFDDGKSHYWGNSRGPLHRSTAEPATNPAYKAAYQKCNS